MTWIADDQAKDLVDLQRIVARLGADLVLVGAAALRALDSEISRYTEDIDVVVALDLDEFAGLVPLMTSSGWTQEHLQEQRWYGPRNSRMDILPAGPQLRSARRLTWPGSGMTMSLFGFGHVFERAVEVEALDGKTVLVTPLDVLFLLKVVAYLDRPQAREKDLNDIHGLLKRYEYASDRTYSTEVFDAGLSDVEFVPAFLLGTDLATFCDLEERSVLQGFIDKCLDPQSAEFGLLLRHEVQVEPLEERLHMRLSALNKGLNAAWRGGRTGNQGLSQE